jgi:hypothetical protein
VRAELKWKPVDNQPKGRPRKIWMNMVEENLRTLDVEDWRKAVQ